MLTLAALFFGLFTLAFAHKSLRVSVSGPSRADVDELALTTVIANTGNETLKLLNDPRTPLSSWATDTFVVTSESGAVPAFTGVDVRYIPSVAVKANTATFTILEPGGSVNVTHEVGRYYNFTSAGAGTFLFEPANLFQEVTKSGELYDIIADTVPARVYLTGKLVSTQPLSAFSLGGSVHHTVKRASFKSCSATQQSQANTATRDSTSVVNRALGHLNNNPSGSTLQKTWFGTFSSERYSIIKTTFTRLQTSIAQWTYDCSCTDGTIFAYVYPSQYGVVYLCGYFWSAPATGSGSRADTLVHEGTHFKQVGNTLDLVYGQFPSKFLASSNPDNAVQNADNYAFFSANA